MASLLGVVEHAFIKMAAAATAAATAAPQQAYHRSYHSTHYQPESCRIFGRCGGLILPGAAGRFGTAATGARVVLQDNTNKQKPVMTTIILGHHNEGKQNGHRLVNSLYDVTDVIIACVKVKNKTHLLH